MHAHTNHLIRETSPYLLQHAHNPVEWYPWGPEALSQARAENKPILVSIGYAACHWCHVMEKESFENEETARIMNDHFVNIKIDREERPDLDHIYMDAVQAMTGSGGWPLNVFLTPEGKPFYGGTYFPPKRAFNRVSWPELLVSVADAFRNRRHEIDAQAENLTAHLEQANAFGWQQETEGSTHFSRAQTNLAFENIMKTADRAWGGFGNAPKFPQSFVIRFLLRFAYVNHTDESRYKPALDQACLSLDKMIYGGIYDQVGGGFARYSTDSEWLVPHFEKMLYDNALLIDTLSEAFQLTAFDRYRQVIEETMTFVRRELLHPEYGFYSSLDADSEGEEGRFYVWTAGEIDRILGNEAGLFSRFFGVSEQGNWEGKNILWVSKPPEDFARDNHVDLTQLLSLVRRGKSLLLSERSRRIRPLLDDKIILGWNALMNSACSKAFMATGNDEYRQLAVANMRFLLEKFGGKNDPGFYHTWKDGLAKYPAFLDDYAFLIEALIHLQEITSDGSWLVRARELTGFVIENFSETETGLFYYTSKGQDDVIVRKKEVYDGAQPSGNSVMAGNLYRLSLLFDIPEWRERCAGMIRGLERVIGRYPASFGRWADLLQEISCGSLEIAIVGKGHEKARDQLLKNYLPHRIFQTSETGDLRYPLLAGKIADEEAKIYLCKDYACQQPVTSIERFMSLKNSVENSK